MKTDFPGEAAKRWPEILGKDSKRSLPYPETNQLLRGRGARALPSSLSVTCADRIAVALQPSGRQTGFFSALQGAEWVLVR